MVLFQTPQHESKDKKMKLFTSGTVAMDVDLEKSGFFQGESSHSDSENDSPISQFHISGCFWCFWFAGEGLKVLANIQNNSSREIKPKYCVYRKHSFFAQGKRRLSTKDLLKEVGEPIPPSAHEKVTRVITIPHDAEPSILNCTIIKVEYRLRVGIYVICGMFQTGVCGLSQVNRLKGNPHSSVTACLKCICIIFNGM